LYSDNFGLIWFEVEFKFYVFGLEPELTELGRRVWSESSVTGGTFCLCFSGSS